MGKWGGELEKGQGHRRRVGERGPRRRDGEKKRMGEHERRIERKELRGRRVGRARE